MDDGTRRYDCPSGRLRSLFFVFTFKYMFFMLPVLLLSFSRVFMYCLTDKIYQMPRIAHLVHTTVRTRETTRLAFFTVLRSLTRVVVQWTPF